MIPHIGFSHLPLTELLREEGFACNCGKHHHTDVKEVSIGHDILGQLPDMVRRYGGTKPFLLADQNTQLAAGGKIEHLMKEQNMEFSGYLFPQNHLEPDEFAVGQAAMNFDGSCDFIIAIGSGTINDISKILAKVTNLPYVIVGTAPSMDGFASKTSSMISNGIKVTLDSACPIAILADLDVVCRAPEKMLQAGLGDMVAKYISLCEWRISHLINDEYYCEEIASLVRHSLEKCVQSVDGLRKRHPKAIADVLEGLILSGIAMGFAGISRPASGVEHYLSHIWEMRALEFHTNSDLHGIQVGVGTILSLKIYDLVRTLTPDQTKALEHVNMFNHQEYNVFLQEFLGSSAKDLVQLEKKEGKYDKAKHSLRLKRIMNHWQDILRIIDEELPAAEAVRDLLEAIGAPLDPIALGLSEDEIRKTFIASKDIRDKYSVSRLLWDIGMLDQVAAAFI